MSEQAAGAGSGHATDAGTRRETTGRGESSNKPSEGEPEEEAAAAEDSGWVKPDHPPPHFTSDLENDDIDTHSPAKRREMHSEATNTEAETETEPVWVHSPLSTSPSRSRQPRSQQDADEDIRMRDGSADTEDLESSVVVDKPTRRGEWKHES